MAEPEEVSFDEFFGPHFARVKEYARRVQAGEELTEEDLRALGEACSVIETYADSVNVGTPEETAEVRRQLRAVAASMRAHMDDDVNLVGIEIPDDPSGV